MVMDERYYICGGVGKVRIFDRKHQKYVSGLFFDSFEDANAFLTKLEAPKGFGRFLEKKIKIGVDTLEL